MKKNNIWISSKRIQYKLGEAKKYGTVVALFYYSKDNNLILKSKESINLKSIKLDEEIFIDSYLFNKSRNSLLINLIIIISLNNNSLYILIFSLISLSVVFLFASDKALLFKLLLNIFGNFKLGNSLFLFT